MIQINASVILAAGKGKRMKDSLPKALQTILGKDMIGFLLDGLKQVENLDVYAVLGANKEQILKKYPNLNYFHQKKASGTLDAIKIASELKDKYQNLVIVAADQPFIRTETIKCLLNVHLKNENDLTFVTTKVKNPTGYGRIIDKKIVEEKELTELQKKIDEVNISLYCFKTENLFQEISKVKEKNGEYYLTDLIEIYHDNKLKVEKLLILDDFQFTGINDKIALESATNKLKLEINNKHLKNGVKIIDKNNTYIGPDVIIESGSTIYPNSWIVGKSIIRKAVIIKNSYISDSEIGENSQVGPYAQLRNNTVIKKNVKIGNYVEIKNSTLSDDVKCAHLSYIGDTYIGENANIGAGVITANYDGKKKHKTCIGENSFIGSNVCLVAPIKIGAKAVIAAGSTVTKDVESNSLVIARKKETIKNNYFE